MCLRLTVANPARLLADFGAKRSIYLMSASWHPDGKRISIWAGNTSGPSFWTLPATGGIAVQSEIVPEVAKQLGEASVGSGVEPTMDLEFLLGAFGNGDLLRAHI